MKNLLWLVAALAALLVACEAPTTPKTSNSQDLANPGTVLKDLAFSAAALPASLNLGQTTPTARSLVTAGQLSGTAIVGSNYAQVLKNIQVNLPLMLVKGLQTSSAVTNPNLKVGDVVTVGTITMTMGTTPTTVSNAGKLTTALSADGQVLSYYWHLGSAIGGDMKILLQVKKDRSVVLYMTAGDGTYTKSDSSTTGVFTYANNLGGMKTYLVVDGSDPKNFKTWVGGVSSNLSLYEVALGNDTFGGVLLFNDTPAGKLMSIEHYDASGNLVGLLDGSTSSGTNTVTLHGITFGTSHEYPLSSFDVASGYQWARVANGSWYTQADQYGHWDGQTVVPSSGAYNTDTDYDNWLEQLDPATSTDQYDAGADVKPNLLTTTALKWDATSKGLTGTIHQRVYDSSGLPAQLTVKSAVASSMATSQAALITYDTQMSAKPEVGTYLDDAQGILTAADSHFPALN